MSYLERYSALDLQTATTDGVKVVADIVNTVGPRASGSEQELKGQEMLAEKIRPYADEVKTEPFSVHRQAFMGFIPFTVIVGVIAVFVNWFANPWIAFILDIIAFVPLILEFLMYKEFCDPLFPKQTSHNTYAVIKPRGEVKQRFIMASHSDSQYEWTINYLIGGLTAKLAVEIPAVVGLVIQTIYNLVCGIIGHGAAANTIEKPHWFILAFFIVSCIMIPFELSFIFFQSHTKSVPGASDNLSGCAVNLEVVKALKDAGIELENTEVVALFTGSEEVGLRGAKAFARDHADMKDDLPTIAIALDTFRDLEDMAIYDRDLSGTLQHDWQVKQLLKESAERVGRPLPFASIYVGGSDAAAFTQAGFQASCLAAMNPDPPRYYHTRLDTVDNMRPEAITAGLEIMIESLLTYDAEGLPEAPQKK